ncbi:MAG: hypothetical protein Tsb0032_18120 [Kiloniellaceae bacterium]
MVKAGKMMCAETVKANWNRARVIASKDSNMTGQLSSVVQESHRMASAGTPGEADALSLGAFAAGRPRQNPIQRKDIDLPI